MGYDERQGLRDEIVTYNWQLFITTLVILVLMVFATYWSQNHADGSLWFVNVLGISWAFTMARYDYLMHRIRAFLIYDSEWENSPARNQKKWVMVISDLGSILPILVLFFNAVYIEWSMGYRFNSAISVALMLFGIALIAVAGSIGNEK